MIFAFDSDVGCKRSKNEDCYFVPSESAKLQNVGIVADGMGGYNAGEVASRTAVDSVVSYLSEYDGDISLNGIRSAIRCANGKIMDMVKSDIRLKGMGTTITVAVVEQKYLLIGHVGDSRAYVISKNGIKQITKDHSYVQMLIDSGEITLEEAYEHPYKNVITRAVGVERRVKIDTFEYPIEEGDVAVLCSDGLVKFVSDEEIYDNMKGDLFEGVSKLISLAKSRGGDDNITVVAVWNKDIILDNRYKLIRQIGSGGMSQVFCAMDMEDENKYVSIKLLKKELFSDENIRNMFKKEAKIAIKLKHKNIISAKRIVEEADKMYIVLDYVEGENLKDYMEKHGSIDENTAINIALQIARALRFAHNNGYIHKDVKPQNVIIDENMNAYLTDFGLASKQDEGSDKKGDLVLGSVYYFSPEHAKGEAVNMRSDIYSLGIVLYEMLTGDLPFKGESTHEVIMGHIHKEPVSPNEYNRNISVAISQVILKAIDKDCSMRYVNFNSFMADMKKAQKHPGGGFVEYKPVPISHNTSTFKWTKIAVSFAVIGAMFSFLFIFSYFAFENNPSHENYGMPNLVNMSMKDAIARLEEMGVKYTIEYYENDTSPNGRVLEQSVRENVDIPVNTPVVIGVAINSKDNQMPDFYRINRNDAVAFLNSANITNVNVEYVDSDLPYNFVVSQTPSAGKSLRNVKESKLYVSNNHTDMQVPQLVGQDLYQAKEMAEQNGFTLGIVYEENGKDLVINKQLPVYGAQIVDDLSIDVWIGRNYNKNVPFSTALNLVVKDDATKIIVCYEEDDGILYYVDEFSLDTGIYQRNIRFYGLNNNPKKVHIFYNNVRQRIVENVEAD